MAIHIWDIMDDTVVKTVRNVTKIGEKQSNSFANERLVERSKPVTQPLKKNNLPTFTSTNKKTVSKDKTKVEVLKDDCASFLRLYIACQICDGNAEDFFKYENQLWQPPQCIYSTYDEGILSSTERTEMSLLAPCTHEEEDTRLTVHVLDATSSGHR